MLFWVHGTDVIGRSCPCVCEGVQVFRQQQTRDIFSPSPDAPYPPLTTIEAVREPNADGRGSQAGQPEVSRAVEEAALGNDLFGARSEGTN